MLQRIMSSRGLMTKIGAVRNTKADVDFIKLLSKDTPDTFESVNKVSRVGFIRQLLMDKIDKMISEAFNLKIID